MVDQHVDVPAAGSPPAETALGAGTPPPSAPPANEGRTVAAWTTTAVVVLGAIVVAVGMVLATPWLAWTGGGVAILGLVVGGVLSALGYGQPHRRPTTH